MGNKRLIFIILFILSAVIFYNIDFSKGESFVVTRVIDGDTIELETGMKVRLLGINTPEKGRYYSDKATLFLETLVLNKKVKIKSQGADMYGRILGYLFIDKRNVNELILGNGLANLYYYEKDEYYSDLKYAEKFARENELGIWEKSENFGCIRLIELDYFDEKDEDYETLKLENICSETILIKIKDDANHYYERNLNKGIYEEQFQNIFNDDGDSLFIWDAEGKLLLFYRY